MDQQSSLELHSLPDDVANLFQPLDIDPYLLAHLVLVHDTARRLIYGIQARWPNLSYDAQLVLFGAATHDIGKIVHLDEMAGPGKKHHAAGVQFLQQLGVDPQRARFARTHAGWRDHETLSLEDLFVALADVVWSGGREHELERVVTERLAGSDGRELWETFMDLDDILTEITREGELRLVWQTQFSPERSDSQQS